MNRIRSAAEVTIIVTAALAMIFVVMCMLALEASHKFLARDTPLHESFATIRMIGEVAIAGCALVVLLLGSLSEYYITRLCRKAVT